MEKQEKRSTAILFEPLHCAPGYLAGRALEIESLHEEISRRAKAAVVDVEALVEAKAAGKEEAPDKCGSSITLRFKDGGESSQTRWNLLTVFLNPVYKRIGRAQQGCVGRKRERNLRINLREKRAPAGQRINVGGGMTSVAVATEMVGPKSVHRNEDDWGGRGEALKSRQGTWEAKRQDAG